MADNNFYQYMLAAFRYKRKNETAASFPYLGYNLNYETIGTNWGIYYYARNGVTALPKIYTKFPDTKEGNLQMVIQVLDNLDRHLDPQLDKYFNRTVNVQEDNAKQDVTAPIAIPIAGVPRVSNLPSTPITSSRPPRITIDNTPQNIKEGAVDEEKLPTTSPSPGRFNFPAFRSRAGKEISGAANRMIGQANPTLKRMGRQLADALSRFPQSGGIGGGILGRLRGVGGIGRIGGGRGAGRSLTGRLKGKGGLKFAIVLIGIMLLVSLISITTQNPQTGEAGPISGGGNNTKTDISSCKFTRGSESPQEVSYKSNLLLSYIQEASQKSGIPPVVLAAFIRVESPSSSNMSDDQILNYSINCAQSPTGALGIMQIQPPGTTSLRGDPASCDDCIDAGAKLIGKTVSAMTRLDYCDPRTNIIVGAGWILKKMNKLGYGDGTVWKPEWTNDQNAIKALVNTYYGCLDYGTAECTGPYNYANDVTASIQNCQATAAGGGANLGIAPGIATDCPIPNGIVTCGSQATPINGCGHCGAGYPDLATKDYCGFAGTKYSLDIGGQEFQSIFLPKIGGNIITWSYQGEEIGKTEAIQRYTGIFSDGFALQTYYLQLHHTQPGSGNSSAKQSGDLGGKICGNGCGQGHVHIQIGSGGDNQNNTGWLDAAQYFCKK